MKAFIELVKLDLPFAIYEAKSLLGLKSTKLYDNFLLTLVVDSSIRYFERLAYSRNLYRIIWQREHLSAESKLESYDFSIDITGSYKISFVNIDDPALIKKVYRAVWLKLKTPKVKLKDPDCEIVIMKFNDTIFCCKKISVIHQDYKSRLPNKREGFRPISLHPRLARALVNITGCRDGTIIDPFCGIGGIPIEAMLMGIKTKAYDLDEVMTRISDHNFKKFGFSKNLYQIEARDFFTSREKMRYLAADLPYGKNTHNVEIDFYQKVLVHLSKILIGRAVIIFPHWIDVEAIIKKHKISLNIKTKFVHFVHKSMSRVVYVFEKPK